MNYYEDLSQTLMYDPNERNACSCNPPQHHVPTNPTPTQRCGIPLGNNEPLFPVETGFMMGNLFEGLYDDYRGFTNYPLQPTNQQEALLYSLLAYKFAFHELNLLLDVDPNNHPLLHLFHEYHKKYLDLVAQYTSLYGPLSTLDSHDHQTFDWIQGPWPWENRKRGEH